MTDAWRTLAEVRDQARAAKDVLRRDLPAIAVEGSSPDGAVRLTVNADGVLLGLRLGDGVSAMSPVEIANAVLRTYGQAQRAAADEAAELLAGVGGNSYLSDRFAWRREFVPELMPDSRPAARENNDEWPHVMREEW